MLVSGWGSRYMPEQVTRRLRNLNMHAGPVSWVMEQLQEDVWSGSCTRVRSGGVQCGKESYDEGSSRQRAVTRA